MKSTSKDPISYISDSDKSSRYIGWEHSDMPCEIISIIAVRNRIDRIDPSFYTRSISRECIERDFHDDSFCHSCESRNLKLFLDIHIFQIHLCINKESVEYRLCIWCDDSSFIELMKDETFGSARFTDEHPEILEIHSICLIDDEISSLQCSLIFLTLIGIEMMWDSSTPESYPWLLPTRKSIDMFKFHFWHI